MPIPRDARSLHSLTPKELRPGLIPDHEVCRVPHGRTSRTTRSDRSSYRLRCPQLRRAKETGPNEGGPEGPPLRVSGLWRGSATRSRVVACYWQADRLELASRIAMQSIASVRYSRPPVPGDLTGVLRETPVATVGARHATAISLRSCFREDNPQVQNSTSRPGTMGRLKPAPTKRKKADLKVRLYACLGFRAWVIARATPKRRNSVPLCLCLPDEAEAKSGGPWGRLSSGADRG
jgi:hypothetical protein